MAKSSSDQLPQNGVAEPAAQALERAREEASQLFQHANLDHPAMQVLQQLCIRRRVRHLSGED